MRKWLFSVLAVLPGISLAGNFTQWAVPTRVDVVRNEGVMIYGSLGIPTDARRPTRSSSRWAMRNTTRYTHS